MRIKLIVILRSYAQAFRIAWPLSIYIEHSDWIHKMTCRYSVNVSNDQVEANFFVKIPILL